MVRHKKTAQEQGAFATAAIRKAAVAGTFYPRKAELLQRQVDDCLTEAEIQVDRPPKAIIGPHAGYVFSGAIAGSAYAPLVGAAIERVVLIGPSHYVPFQGIAVPSHDAFATPLGTVAVDRPSLDHLIANMPQIHVNDDAHGREHSLETHLPFLQTALSSFKLIPLVTGAIRGEEVAEVLRQVWGGPETCIAVSSDLSHFLDYASAQARDRQTSDAILALEPESINEEDACGCRAIQGLLIEAKRRRLRSRLHDLRNSADTAGDPKRVVGYGAYAFYE